MKKFFVFPIVIALVAFVSCQKQQTEAEKNAEVERQVQERLAAEHQTEQQQQLEQRQADLDAREKAMAEKQNAATSTPARSERAESETTESRIRGAQPRERAITTGYSTFYNKLESYGDWIETGDYGYVFHPREAESSRSWRPYTNGRWVYSDAGWTWISEEPFGWATYHYGRWTRLRGIGWVWVPGNQWAPAWVSWRKSNDYVGWAPLPPEARFDQRTGIHNWSDNYYDIGPDQYCFVASREFGAPRVQQTLLPPERNVTIVNQTTNVTNITYNNTTIVNEGPSYDEVRAQSSEPVQRYRLERNVSLDVSGESRSVVRGETIVVAAPVFAEPVANERPTTVKQTIAAAAVDLGWAAIANQEEAKKTRQKMKSEAAPPANPPSKKFVKAAAATSTTAKSSETIPTSTSTAATAAPSTATTATPVATAVATSTPISSPSASPTAAQRRGRLLIPSATPSPRPSAATSPIARDTVPSTGINPPVPEGSPLVPTGSPQGQMGKGKFKSQAQQFQPKKVEQMPSASPSATRESSQPKAGDKVSRVPNAPASVAPIERSTSSPEPASTPSATPAGKLSKQEKKEQKREEKKEMKRERREGNAPASPSATP